MGHSGGVQWRSGLMVGCAGAVAVLVLMPGTTARCHAGCGELSDQTDCACNVHAAGGHLLCHDDVIGNRRVSYIVYLTGGWVGRGAE